MSSRTKAVSKRLMNRKQRKAAWLEAAKRIEQRYRINAREARMVAAIAVDWLRDQASLAGETIAYPRLHRLSR